MDTAHCISVVAPRAHASTSFDASRGLARFGRSKCGHRRGTLRSPWSDSNHGDTCHTVLYDPVSTWKRGKSFVPVKLLSAVREREDNRILIFVQMRRAYVFERRNAVAVELSEVRESD